MIEGGELQVLFRRVKFEEKGKCGQIPLHGHLSIRTFCASCESSYEAYEVCYPTDKVRVEILEFGGQNLLWLHADGARLRYEARRGDPSICD
jgi:hypothetical protein